MSALLLKATMVWLAALTLSATANAKTPSSHGAAKKSFVSREQVGKLTAIVGPNNRPVQSVNNRMLLAPGRVN